MAKFNKNKGGTAPTISTASLPDIVFMLLFFFMVATVMRESEIKVQQTLPKANEVEKLQNKNLVMYIYAGKPSLRYQAKYGSSSRIQLNDSFARIQDIDPFIAHEKNQQNPGVRNQMVTSLKIDEETNMGLVSDIKEALKDAEAYKINYTTRTGDAEENL